MILLHYKPTFNIGITYYKQYSKAIQFHIQVFSTFSPFLPSVTFFIRSFSTFGHVLCSVILHSVFLRSVILLLFFFYLQSFYVQSFYIRSFYVRSRFLIYSYIDHHTFRSGSSCLLYSTRSSLVQIRSIILWIRIAMRIYQDHHFYSTDQSHHNLNAY